MTRALNAAAVMAAALFVAATVHTAAVITGGHL